MQTITRTLSLALTVLAGCGSLVAQRTFVVDAQGGPGVDFTDFSRALQQAQHGDRFLVFPGPQPYRLSPNPLVVDKGVQILGQRRNGLYPVLSGLLSISNVPAGRTVLMSNMMTWVRVEDNDGVVHVDRMRNQPGFGFMPRIGGIRTHQLFVTSGDFGSLGSGIRNLTRGVFVNSRFRTVVGFAVLVSERARLHLVGSEVLGAAVGGPPCNPPTIRGGTALEVDAGSRAFLAADNVILGGPSGCGPRGYQTFGDGLLWVDSAFPLDPTPFATILEMCSLTPEAAVAGSPCQVDVWAPTNQSVIVAADFALAPQPIPLAGDLPDLWLDPATMFPIACVTANGRTTSLQIAIPASVPSGTIAYLQAASVGPGGGGLRTSPCVPIIVE